MKKYTKEIFITKVKEIHGNKYDYSLVDYKNSQTKVKIICPVHGEFWQTPQSHLNGNGCPSCAGLKKRNTEDFIKCAKEVHGDRYDYSKTVYVNKRSLVIIGCKIHGDFCQCANNHLRGQGCPECGKKYASEYKKGNYHSFILESEKRFDNQYEFPYIENEYENSHSKITIKCKKCGTIFTKIACDHLTSPGGGCPSCFSHASKSENEIYDYIVSLVGQENVQKDDRNVISPLEIDILVDKLNIGFEYNGLYWHSDINDKYKNYHLEKTESAKSKGIGLVQIFEDEYVNHKDIVLSKIRHLLHVDDNLPKIYARKCTVKKITYHEASSFLENNHIQGKASATIYLGAFYQDKLVGVMTFKAEDSNGLRYELSRFATDIHYTSCGLGGKLFKYFIDNWYPVEVKSFADRRWTINEDKNLYINLGFRFDSYIKPDYRYVKNNEIKRYHKFNFRKSILHKKYGLDLSMTENEMCKELKYYKIWDCGLIKYVWKNAEL